MYSPMAPPLAEIPVQGDSTAYLHSMPATNAMSTAILAWAPAKTAPAVISPRQDSGCTFKGMPVCRCAPLAPTNAAAIAPASPASRPASPALGLRSCSASAATTSPTAPITPPSSTTSTSATACAPSRVLLASISGRATPTSASNARWNVWAASALRPTALSRTSALWASTSIGQRTAAWQTVPKATTPVLLLNSARSAQEGAVLARLQGCWTAKFAKEIPVLALPSSKKSVVTGACPSASRASTPWFQISSATFAT